MEQITNFGRTTLTSGIDDDDTSIAVGDGSVFPSSGNFRLNCEDELMLCTARSGSTLTVTRGIEGTTPASHSLGRVITQVITAGSITALLDERTVAQKLWIYQNFK